MKSKQGVVEWAMRYHKIILLVMSLLVIAGVYSLQKMPKQEFPVYTIRQGVVIGVYPGANVHDVEEQLTKPLEKYLLTFKEVNRKKTYSHSKDGIVYVFVELTDDTNNKDEVWSKIKHGLATFKSILPSGVMALIANDDFGDTSAILITLESEDKTYREMGSYLDLLEDRLRKVESVSSLKRSGEQKEQIAIYLDQDKLSVYGIGQTTLMINLMTNGFTTSSGMIDDDNMVAPIYIAPSIQSEQEIEDQIVYSDPKGNVIRLKDVARVVREYPEPDSYIKNNGKRCVLLSVEMMKGNNVVEFGEKVNAVLEEFQQELPKSVNMYRIADQPKLVGESIHTFLRELMLAIVAVMLVTIILLPFRVAAVAAVSIPISIFISLAIMYAFGIELNTVTLAALIVVLGMIVDNSIVIVDSYIEMLDHGMSRWHAAIASAKEYFKSILSATLAISITFFPFLITTTGTMYDFLEYFPWTVTITLGVSLAVAMLIIPFFQYLFIRKGLAHNQQKGQDSKKKDRISFLERIQKIYNQLLSKAFEYPKITLGIAFVSVVLAIFLFNILPQRMMPVAERDQFAVEIYLPKGSSLKQTSIVCDSLENILRKDQRVKSVTSFIGASSPRFHTVYAPNMPSKNYGQFIVNTYSNKETEEILDEYTNKYAFAFPDAYVRFKQLDFQAVTAPIEIRFMGEDIGQLKAEADSLMAYLHTFDQLLWIRTNFEEMLPGVKVSLDPVEAGRLGINRALVSTYLASNLGEVPVSTVWEGDYPVSVKIKSENRNPDFDDIGNIQVSGMIPGGTVPLRQIAEVKPDWTDGQIVHRNGMRCISVLADVKRGENTDKIFSVVREHMDEKVIPNLPRGVKSEYGGAKETDEEVVPPMEKAMLIAFFIIYFILIFHFKKLSMANLVLGSSLLSLFGAAFGVWVMGIDFSTTAMLGIISLVGIIVRNGIIMFDYTEELRKKRKYSVKKAAFEAGKRRMRPIFLTSAAASVGVLPMIISKSLLWSPLGTVICFGTMITMVFVVTVLPVAYWKIFERTDKYPSSDEKITNA